MKCQTRLTEEGQSSVFIYKYFSMHLQFGLPDRCVGLQLPSSPARVVPLALMVVGSHPLWMDWVLWGRFYVRWGFVCVCFKKSCWGG